MGAIFMVNDHRQQQAWQQGRRRREDGKLAQEIKSVALLCAQQAGRMLHLSVLILFGNQSSFYCRHS